MEQSTRPDRNRLKNGFRNIYPLFTVSRRRDSKPKQAASGWIRNGCGLCSRRDSKLVREVKGDLTHTRRLTRLDVRARLIGNLDFLPKSLGTLQAIGIAGRTAEDVEFGFINDLHFLSRLLGAFEAPCIRRDALHDIRCRRFD